MFFFTYPVVLACIIHIGDFHNTGVEDRLISKADNSRYPSHGILRTKRQTLQETVINFKLFTQTDPGGDGYSLDSWNKSSIVESKYDGSKATVLIIHGFEYRSKSPWLFSMKDALLLKNDINVIVVDWERSYIENLIFPALSAKRVGHATSRLIKMLTTQPNGNTDKIHLIGQGLGAHIAGFVGILEEGKIGRITGLDPTRKSIQNGGTTYQLEINAAKFVDVFHTDISGVGSDELSGTVDIFPHGGKSQPGCSWYSHRDERCNHDRAASLFIESITSNCQFIACNCTEKEITKMTCCTNERSPNLCVNVGYNINREASGEYYLATYNMAPYCSNKCPGKMDSIFEYISPEDPEKISPYFYFVSRKQINGRRIRVNRNDQISYIDPSYDPNKKTVFLTHGFRHSSKVTWVRTTKSALLVKDDINIILVDWFRGAFREFRNYKQAAVNTQVTGLMTCRLIKSLCEKYKANMSNMHLIGHSLGAHISGFTGAFCGSGIGRITGLDPAGSEFTKSIPRFRLDPGDAIFVAAIHTDTNGKFGLIERVADVDFFPNIGMRQPGCAREIRCSHWRSYMYFIESLMSTCSFLACNCTRKEFKDGICNPRFGYDNIRCITMGYETDINARGIFYVETNNHFPFCTGQYPGLKIPINSTYYQH